MSSGPLPAAPGAPAGGGIATTSQSQWAEASEVVDSEPHFQRSEYTMLRMLQSLSQLMRGAHAIHESEPGDVDDGSAGGQMPPWLARPGGVLLLAIATATATPTSPAGVVRGAVPPPPPGPSTQPGPSSERPGPAAAALAALAWADSIGSHMVLQQLPAPTVLWGFASPGARVSVQRLNGSAGTASTIAANTTAADGVWWVTFPGLNAGNETFKFEATTSSSSATIEMDDVVYGDVWLCSGQSNMAVVVAQAFNSTDVLREAAAYATLPTNPLRLFAANMSCGHDKVCHFQQDSSHLSPCTRPPCFTTGPNAGWTPTTPQALSSDGKGSALPVWTGSFSAVCYLYGRQIQAARGYPVGLISSFIGGTPDECWSSKEALAECPATPHSKGHMDWGDCWYSMISPLLRTPIFGAIWYQVRSTFTWRL